MHEIDRIDVRMLTYRQLCERFALYTNLGCDSRAEDMCIVFEMSMTARRPTRTRLITRRRKSAFHVPEGPPDLLNDEARSRRSGRPAQDRCRHYLIRPDRILRP